MRLLDLNVCVIFSLLLASPVGGVIGFEVRSPVEYVSDGSEYIWGPQEFSPFFYDIDNDLGTETLKVSIGDDNELYRNSGIIYTTNAQKTEFEFNQADGYKWGEYWTIGFLGQKCFAGYVQDPYGYPESNSYLAHKSDRDNLLEYEKLSKILIDTETRFELTSENPLELDEGYELVIQGWDDVDGKDRLYISLIDENSRIINSDVINPQDTYTYRKDLGNAEGVVIIAVHFDYILRDQDLAVIDGIWQISETPIEVERGRDYGEMEVEEVYSGTMKILLSNKDEISIHPDDEITLMGNTLGLPFNGNICLKTADQEISTFDPLRFYLSKEIGESGLYEIRSTVESTGNYELVWDADTFSGFYYDLDDGIKTETLQMAMTDEIDLEEYTGIEYSTHTEVQRLKCEDWGEFKVIGFLGGKFFSSYVEGDRDSAYLYYRSEDNPDLMASGHLSQVLMDYDNTDFFEDLTIEAGEFLYLRDGYRLMIESTDLSGDKVNVVLFKGDDVVDIGVVQPSINGATVEDRTYIYMKPLSEESTEKTVIIAVHFEDAFRATEGSNELEVATIDGIWQISDRPITITDRKFDKMIVEEFDSEQIIMKNTEDKIHLTRKYDSPLMGDIRIKTSDQIDIPRRFYLYKGCAVDRHELVTGQSIYVDRNIYI